MENFWNSSVFSRIPYKVLVLWIVLVLLGYYLTMPRMLSSTDSTSTSSLEYSPYSYHTQSALISNRMKELMPQAIVFIAMGNLARESLVHDAISAVRLVGHWTESIIILTDRPACFEQFTTPGNSNTETIVVPSKKNIIEIKTMKAEIFRYLPAQVDRVLYMDVDILITRNIGFYLQDLTHLLYLYQQKQFANSAMEGREGSKGSSRKHLQGRALEASVSSVQTTASSPASTPPVAGSSSNAVSTTASTVTELSTSSHHGLPLGRFDFAAFLDAKGHYVGFCDGCEKWHTGIMYLSRHHGINCLKAWATILNSGKYDTDQQSLDEAERLGNCTYNMAIPSRHLLFAKDYIGMVLTSGQTFIHLTAVNRITEKNPDYFYTEYIVPKIRNSLHPPLKPYSRNAPPKQC